MSAMTRRVPPVQGLKEAGSIESPPTELGELEITLTPPPGPIDLDTAKRYQDLGVARLTLLPGELDDKGTPGDGAVRFIENVVQQFNL